MPKDAETVAAVAAERRASASTERMRRSRERQRKGLRCLTIELRETEIDALVRRKRLSNEDRSNLTAIRTAIYAFLDDYLR